MAINLALNGRRGKPAASISPRQTLTTLPAAHPVSLALIRKHCVLALPLD